MSTPMPTPRHREGMHTLHPSSTRRRWSLVGAALVAVAAATTAVVVLDGSSTDPTPIGITRTVDVDDGAVAPTDPGLVSADAAERRASVAADAAAAGCAGLAADAAERCMQGG